MNERCAWASVDEFYADTPARVSSSEADCRMQWRAPGDPLPDPLDLDAVADALEQRLEPAAQPWAFSLFRDPICIDSENAYVGGRHRSVCLQQSGAEEAVAEFTGAQQAARQTLPAPEKPLVSWL